MRRDEVMQRIYADRGLAAKIAGRIGVSNQAIHQWKRVPPEHVMTVAEFTKLKPEQIRPDVFRPMHEFKRRA